jgi:hypothetical protein
MIQLNQDALVFQMPGGDSIPCSAEMVTVQLIGDANDSLDPEVIRNAARAVLHYFKHEQGRTHVSLGEFAEALASVLRSFGLAVAEAQVTSEPAEDPACDLRRLAEDAGSACELAFFPSLRQELRRQLDSASGTLRFTGLRACAKKLAGSRRWCARSQSLSDRILQFLRDCLSSERQAGSRALLVR